MPRDAQRGNSRGDGHGRGRGGGGGRSAPDNLSREVMISKALSRLLRHAAVQERIPIDSHGYVRMDHLLGWHRLKSMQPRVGVEDVVEVVKGSVKMRFGLKYDAKKDGQEVKGGSVDVENVPNSGVEANYEDYTAEEVVRSETQKAVEVFENGNDTDLEHFFIRANQGHSMKGVEAENLLEPITLEDEASVPKTVVHGTFHAAYGMIMRDGGLKCMKRNHIHFSTGPPVEDVLERCDQGESLQKEQGKVKFNDQRVLANLLEKNKVVSGMRPNASILIYVDIRKALKEREMKWWKSENGVILTEGVNGMVPIKYWDKVVEVHVGHGLIWDSEKGVVVKPIVFSEVPFGRGKGGAGAGTGAGGRKAEKPKLKVEREELQDA